MKLGLLKASLNRFSGDLDDSEVMFTFMANGEQKYDILAFVAYSQLGEEEQPIAVLGSSEVATELIKRRTLKFADGSTAEDHGFDLNGPPTD